MLFSFYYKFPYLTRYIWPEKCSNDLLFHYKQSTLICSHMVGAGVMTYLLFALGIILFIAISIPIMKDFISNFKTSSYVMAEVKTIPSTVHVPCHSYLTAQVRKFYEVTFFTNFTWWFLFETKFEIFFTKTKKKIKKVSAWKA